MTELQKYEKWDPAAIEAERKAIDNASPFFKLKQGRTAMRILPPRPGAKSPFQKVYQHYVEMPGMSSAASFACPRLNGARRPCPVCQMADQLRASGNPADAEVGNKLRASKRIYANAIIRDEEERGPVIFPFGKMIYEGLMDLAYDPDWGDFSDPGPDGYDVTISRKGMGMTDTRYKVVGSRNTSPLSPDADQMAAWLDSSHDLTRFAEVPTEEELAAKLGGSIGGPPPQKRSKTRQDDFIDADYQIG